MSNLTGKGLAENAKKRLGTPYFYGSKTQNGELTEKYMKTMHSYYPKVVTNSYMAKARKKGQVGKVNVDCSGLISDYTGKIIGSSQLYSSAKKRLPIAEVENFAIGTVLWKSGHVGIYIGMENGVPMCIEAKGIDYGTVKTKVSATSWKYGLTFDYMEYDYDVKVLGDSKKKNPYTQPTVNVKYGMKGELVKWLQFELNESGYDIAIDGVYGKETKKALGKFQKSAKLEVDYICGPMTRKALLNE